MDGTRFRGEPVSIMGPLALFRTKADTLKRSPLPPLSVEDCQRVHQALATRPPRTARWATARRAATRELVGTTLQLDFARHKRAAADLTGMAEPERLVVRCRDSNLPGAWLVRWIPGACVQPRGPRRIRRY